MTVAVEIYGRNMEVNDRLKDYISKKASKLDRYLREIEQVKVDLEYFKTARNATDRFAAQITVRGHRALLRTEERSDDVTTAYDVTIDRMQRQLERYKGKHYRGRGNSHAKLETTPEVPTLSDSTPDERVNIISRRKTFTLNPMSEAEALEQMELLGHDNFFIFYNIENATTSVLYRRRDGTFGLIEPMIG